MILPFKTPEEWAAAGKEAAKLMGDQAISDALLVLANGRLLSALAKQVLHRTLQEEKASEHMYEYILEAAANKANLDGLALDLGKLQEALETFMLVFVKDEIARVESAAAVSDLKRLSLQRDIVCEVGILDRWIEIPPGHLLLVCGSAETVHAQIEAIAASGGNYRYSAERSVAPSDILYLSHSFGRGGDVEARPQYCSVDRWRGQAKNLKRWRKLLAGQSRKFFTVVSNLTLAASEAFDKPGFKPQEAAVLGINTLSKHLTKAIERTVAGLYVPRDDPDEFKEAVHTCVTALDNVTLVLV